MKKLSLTLLLGLTFAFVACGKKDEKKNEGAPSTTCLQQTCDNSIYANNTEKGFHTFNDSAWNGQPYLLAAQTSYYNTYQPYNSASFQNGQFCGCSSGYTPVFNSLAGFGCVQSRLIQPIATAMVYWTIQTNQQTFTEHSSTIGASYVQQSALTTPGSAYTFNTNKCTNFVAEACIVNQPEACREGSCQATVNGSPLGVCLK